MLKSRLAIISLSIAIALTVAGCASTTSARTPSATATNTATAAVPDVTGLAGDVARDTLTAAGFIVDWGGEMVVKASNWTVTSQSPAAGESADTGSSVVLTVEKPEAAPVEEPATSAGLTGTYAQSACDQRMRQEFVYGYNPAWVFGRLADEIQDDRWYLKVEVKVANGYGAEQQMNVECYVSGTNDAPVVDDFLAY